MKAVNGSAEYIKNRGWLTAEQKLVIAHEIATTKRRYVDIALDWLVSESRVRKLAREFGVMRQHREWMRKPQQGAQG